MSGTLARILHSLVAVLLIMAIASITEAQEKVTTTPTIKALRAILGKEPESKEVSDFRDDMKDAPLVEKFNREEFGNPFFYSWKERGISLAFTKNVATGVFLYAKGSDGFKQFSGELPLGLLFSDSRREVEKKLGMPEITGGDGVIPFWVKYRKLGVSIGYASKDVEDRDNKIHHVCIAAADNK